MTSHEPKPDKWTDLLRPGYDYPADIDADADGLTGRRRRRAVRAAKREWRQRDKQARQEWIAEHRVKESASPEARIGFVVVIALIVGVVMLVSALRGEEDDAPAAEPSTAVEATDEQPSAATGEDPTTPTAGESEGITPSDDASPDDIAAEWARAWFTYAPSHGDDVSQRIDRAAPVQTDSMTQWVMDNDNTSAYYDAEDIDVAVTGVRVERAPAGAPVDHETRATRLVIVTTTQTAADSTPAEFVQPYLVTIERAAQDQPWRVGAFEVAPHE